MGPAGTNSYYESSGKGLRDVPAGNRWLGYRAILTSVDGGNSPVLREVEIVCRRR
jgi:hypothetical protein